VRHCASASVATPASLAYIHSQDGRFSRQQWPGLFSVVESGDVDVVSNDGNGESLAGSFKEGDYFGHVTPPSPDCCIRARTRVRLLAIDREAADALSAVRPDLALLLKKGKSSTPETQSV
jgi:CRP-like cAMP-binding protein